MRYIRENTRRPSKYRAYAGVNTRATRTGCLVLRFASFNESSESPGACGTTHSILLQNNLLTFNFFHSWQLFATVDVLVAIITAARNDSSANGSHAASFASVWTLFLVVGVSVSGTIILRKVSLDKYIFDLGEPVRPVNTPLGSCRTCGEELCVAEQAWTFRH